MTFEDQLNALIYFHLEEYASGRHLLQALEEDDFARDVIALSKGIKKSSFSEAINNRGLEQLAEIFQNLYAKATTTLPKEYHDLGDLTSIDGSLVDPVLSMYWADYRDGSKKAKVHIGFDLNHSIPSRIFLTDGKADERPFANISKVDPTVKTEIWRKISYNLGSEIVYPGRERCRCGTPSLPPATFL